MSLWDAFRHSITGGTSEYKNFIDQRSDWLDQQLAQQGIANPATYTQASGAGGGELNLTPQQLAQYEAAPDGTHEQLLRQFQAEAQQQEQVYQTAVQQLIAKYPDTLPPGEKEAYLQEMQQHTDEMQTIQTYGSMATKMVLGAIAGGAGAAALGGAAAGTAAVPAEALATSTATSGGGSGLLGTAAGSATAAPLTAAEAAMYTPAGLESTLGTAGTNAATGATQAVNITGQAAGAATGVGAATGAAATLPFDLNSLPPPGAGPTQPATERVEVTDSANPNDPNFIPPISPVGPTSAPQNQNPYPEEFTERPVESKMADEPFSLDKMIKAAQNMSGMDWVKAGLGTLSMYNAVKGMTNSGPDAPDYQKLNQQNLLADRPNQENAYGDTSTWTQNPDGTWSQKTSFGATNQGLYDSAASLRGGLLDQAKNTAPLTTSGLPELGGIVMNPQGDNKAITDAWLARMRPELDRGREAEMQRLANMGVTENRYGGENQAFGNAMDVLNRKDVDATNQALIYGTDAYNKTFQNSIQADQANRGNYQTEFNVNKDVANNPYYQLQQSQGAIPGSPTFQQPGGNPNAMQAGQLDYKAQLDARNAELAQLQKNTAGLWDLYKTFGGT